MKRTLFQFSFGDGYAGSAKIAIISSELMMRKGYNVFLFATENSLTERRAEEKGINVISLNSRNKFNELMKEIFIFFEKENPDWIINYHSLDRKAGITLKRKFKKKFINIAYRQNESLSTPIIGSFIYNLYYDYQIACSRGVAGSLIKSGIKKRKVKVIHNGIEVPNNLKEISGANIREKFSFGNKTVLGLSTWFHKERKGFDILFKAFAALDKNYALLIVGIPEETQKEVKEYAESFGVDSSRIFMPGYVDNIWEYYKAMDIFLLPSRSEGFSLALMEAGAAKLPLIASNIPGNNELIENGINGFLFDIKRPEELKEKIIRLNSDEEQRKLFAERVHGKVMNNFLIEHLAERLDLFLSEIKMR